jgi:hypothetical protein
VAQTPQERRAAQRRIAKELKGGDYQPQTTAGATRQKRYDLYKAILGQKKELFRGKLRVQDQIKYLKTLTIKELERQHRLLKRTLASDDPDQFIADHTDERGERDPAYNYQ